MAVGAPLLRTIERLLPHFFLGSIVVQPTPLCNLNCSYCYLPNRMSKHRMSPALSSRLAQSVIAIGEPVSLVWHGGEPLACGLAAFSALIQPFSGKAVARLVRHCLQTNATMITDEWCDLFQTHDIAVGVSIDGDRDLNVHRRDWSGRQSFEKAWNGIRILQRRLIDFSVIAVVTESSLERAHQLYNFFASEGCKAVGINIVEREGANRSTIPDDERVTRFWEDLFEAWQANPVVEIREFSNTVRWLIKNYDDDAPNAFQLIDIFPSIAHNGDVVLLSPELMSTVDPQYDNFVVGNLFSESLEMILERASSVGYVQEYLLGLTQCRNTCEFFGVCGGGQASNKYFELKNLSTTETAFCRNNAQRVTRALLSKC